MEDIIKEIDKKYGEVMYNLQDEISILQNKLNTVTSTLEEEKHQVREYYKAMDDKAQAELIIANTPEEIKERIK